MRGVYQGNKFDITKFRRGRDTIWVPPPPRIRRDPFGKTFNVPKGDKKKD